MRCIGGDRAELSTFCDIMDLPPPFQKSSYNLINKTIENATSSVQAESMKAAAAIEQSLAEESQSDVRDVDISVDGTYMTRGHTSSIGVVTAIGLATGNVLDTGVKCKQCKSCYYWKQQDATTEKYSQWQATHECTVTHKGSSGSMEAEITKDIFARSN